MAKKPYTARRYCLESIAPTKREADSGLESMIAAGISNATYGPIVASVTGVAGTAITVAIPRPNGDYASGVLAMPGHAMKTGPSMWHVQCYGGDKPESIWRGIVRHAAQLAWSHGEPDDSSFVDCATAQYRPDKSERTERERESLRRELLRYFAWQREYKRLADSGVPASEAHRLAGMNVPA
jgi:hypothetical protein